MNPYESPEKEIELNEAIRVLPDGNYKRWLTHLKHQVEFLCRCFNDTKKENEILRTLNADLQQQIAAANYAKDHQPSV